MTCPRKDVDQAAKQLRGVLREYGDMTNKHGGMSCCNLTKFAEYLNNVLSLLDRANGVPEKKFKPEDKLMLTCFADWGTREKAYPAESYFNYHDV